MGSARKGRMRGFLRRHAARPRTLTLTLTLTPYHPNPLTP